MTYRVSAEMFSITSNGNLLTSLNFIFAQIVTAQLLLITVATGRSNHLKRTINLTDKVC